MAKAEIAGDQIVALDRRRGSRREMEASELQMRAVIAEEKKRNKTQRRRQIDPTTCEREYSDDEVFFMHAMDAYKRSSGRMFPTCSEILEVVRSLGYSKLTQEERTLLDIHGLSAESACESSDTESIETN